ncbi:hypothetical protein GOP47_0010395 [Adiantum capillus-veneris]|uniref:Protein kinase domain-containing protein n=1 Tax=Adiantum capillus-veneris TaxID=13818 RepID=A0A9D4UUP0_ADICA|nr:hypothetical protein GOP47_0010395 [Adiantum capillus-veneris]
MDYTSARGHALLEVQSPPYQQPAEQLFPGCLPHHHHQADQHSLSASCHMDYIDEHHQYNPHRHHHHHHHHHHHIQQQPVQHLHSHPFPVAGGYIDLGGDFIGSEANPCDVLPHLEKEKQGLPQTQYVDQFSGASVQASYKPCDDGYVSVKTHEDAHFPVKNRLHASPSASAFVVPRVKLLCSIDGRIMGRPVDGKLRYCGGDTHIITVDRGICFSDLMGKLSRMYGSVFTLKYQLPGEDLDALVSVSSDDDLQNMLDEYDKMVASGGNSWFRLFIFRSPSDCQTFSHLEIGHGKESCCAQIMQSYINAINGFDSKGASECHLDMHLDNSSNDFQTSSRTASDYTDNTISFPCVPPKVFLRFTSAPSSVSSSPSVASRLHCKQCGTADVFLQMPKDHQGFVTPMNDVDVNTQELSQDCHADSLKCDHHRSHVPGESPRIQQDSSLSRVDAMWMKENGTHFVDSEDTRLRKHERHRETGTILVDTRHDVSKLHESRCETHHRNYPGAQPLTLSVCHGGQVEDDFGQYEPLQHCKQAPFLHQFHHGGSPLHCEDLPRLQRGIDSHGHLQFSQEPMHIHLANANVTSSVPPKPLSSAPSSPRNLHHQGCCCCQQHFQVDRGISVSLGEYRHTKKPFYFGDRTIRRHGLPLLSRFGDGQNFCSDSTALPCPPTLEKGLEWNEQEHDACSRKHTLRRINTHCHLVDCGAKENLAHSFIEPVHGLREGSLHQCSSCFQDFHHVKGQHLDKARALPNPEFQAYTGQYDIHSGKPEENLTTGRLMLDLKADPKSDRVNDSVTGPDYNIGQGTLETRIPSMREGLEASGYVHMQSSRCSSVYQHKESDSDLKSESFSSTDAVAGSLSRNSLEPTGWAESPPLAVHNDEIKERVVHEGTSQVNLIASTIQLVDGTVNHENTGDTCKRPNFDCIDSYARVRSLIAPANAGGLRVEDSPVSYLMHTPEAKSTISNVCSSHPHDCSVSSSQPSALLTLDSDTFRGSTAFALPIYDQSVINSVNNRTFSFGPSDLKSVSTVKEAPEQCLKNRTTFITAPHQSYGQNQEMVKINVQAAPHKIPEQETTSVLEELRALSRHSSRPCSADSSRPCIVKEAPEQCLKNRTTFITAPHQSYGQNQEMVKINVQAAPHKTPELETTSVLEESRALSRHSSRPCSADSVVHDKGNAPLETVPLAQSRVTSEILQEVKVSGSVNCRLEEDEKELPATQAEAEAIARGLQIIKNDDLEDLKELGSGTYGTVFHGKWRGSDVAIKRIKASCFMGSPLEQERLISDFWREAGTLSQLHHPNIVAFYGVVPDGPEGTLATVTEYMVNGSLKQVLLKKDRTIDRRKRLLIAMDAAFGMEYLHSKRIVHFDLKSENLLVNMRDAHRPICKVGDFGLSKVKHQTLVSGGVRGTLPWMAPELLNTKGLVTEKVDVYSFGIVMWELLTGEEPYANMHCGTIIGGIVNDNLRPAIPSWCDPSWRDLMERCWSGNPADRPDFLTVASELRAIASSMNVK